MNTIAQLLSAASNASDRAVRLAYLAEARARLAAESERLRELALLLEGLEGKTVAGQLELASP